MTWNWEEQNWPHFYWDAEKMKKAEDLFLENTGIIIGASKHLSTADHHRFVVDVMSDNAIETSEIEGEYLDRSSVQSSIRRHFGLQTSKRSVQPAEAGIAEMMVDLYKGFSSPLTHKMLWNWHSLIFNGRRDLNIIGGYRDHKELMKIVSGPSYKSKVHFEAPPSDRVLPEMELFLKTFSIKSNDKPLPKITGAGLAHIWFESIHPFEDGNGRIGRSISEKILAQGGEESSLTALSGILLKYRKSYYAELELASRSLDITDWLLWFATAALEAQQTCRYQVEFLIQKTKYLDKLKGKMNGRQEKALLRIFQEDIYGFQGGLSAKNYMRITGATSATTTRDLRDLVQKRALIKMGDRKSTRYFLKIPKFEVKKVKIEDLV